uniref:Uncharacterized protein n=1 Tax=Candidatus Kentrum sp. DK TaxID=2126562 RepID=A0A450RU14_9GAMM|nr:MAG: hypothetical protein BECKDK2373C_GA0170839_100171 [Candidatus Kentron sp. DK]
MGISNARFRGRRFGRFLVPTLCGQECLARPRPQPNRCADVCCGSLFDCNCLPCDVSRRRDAINRLIREMRTWVTLARAGVFSSFPRFEAVKVFIIKRHFPRGIRCALDVPVKPKYRKRAPIPPYKIQRNNGVGWNRCALSAFVLRTALPHTVFHAHTTIAPW